MISSLTFRLLPLAALLTACLSAPPGLPLPTVIIPGSLEAPPGQSLVRTLWAQGVQVYECRQATDASGPGWLFIAPEATLADVNGAPVGRHYAGPTWEAADGSKVVGTVLTRRDAPKAGAIPWLLLSTRSTGVPGLFANVAYVQRIATEGGMAPTGGCGAATLGKRESVPYKAQYTQYAAAR